jgi:hypothetical protein
MITTLAEFEDATAFERLALAEGFPLLANTVTNAMLNLRGAAEGTLVQVMVGGSLGGQARQELIDHLRPLFFGAAWKILDLLLEFAFYADGRRPKKAVWTIEEKKVYANRHCGQCSPWLVHHDLWELICDIYVATVEARHSLVHRRFLLSPAGDMTDIRDRQGVRKPDLTAAEQEAFSKMTQRVASATLTSALSNRERSAIAWLFDQLAAHHKRSPLGGHKTCPIEVVCVDATHTSCGWVVNADRVNEEVRRVFANRPFYDIEIHFPRTGLPPIIGPLEYLPGGSAVPIDPQSPPGWARR